MGHLSMVFDWVGFASGRNIPAAVTAVHAMFMASGDPLPPPFPNAATS